MLCRLHLLVLYLGKWEKKRVDREIDIPGYSALAGLAEGEGDVDEHDDVADRNGDNVSVGFLTLPLHSFISTYWVSQNLSQFCTASA